jgi:hypothetical protein
MTVLWKGDHAEVLSQDQYRYWMLNPVLPRGWAILSDPDLKPRRLWQITATASPVNATAH